MVDYFCRGCLQLHCFDRLLDMAGLCCAAHFRGLQVVPPCASSSTSAMPHTCMPAGASRRSSRWSSCTIG